MIPSTIRAAAAIQSTFSPTQLADYGNIILNGYTTTASGVSTAGAVGSIATATISAAGTNYVNGTYPGIYLGGGKGTFGYATITVSGGAVTSATITTGGRGFTVGQVISLGSLPRTAAGTPATLTVASVNTRKVTPAMKGWTTNYTNFYTQLPPVLAPYSQTYPGMDAGGFLYMVHSFKPPTGAIAAIGFQGPMGYGYTDGLYTNVPTVTGRFGSGATLDLVVAGGSVQSVVLNNPGSDYRPGSTLSIPAAIGPGTGFSVVITGVTGVNLNGNPYWSQRPVMSQGATNSYFPLGQICSWIYPVSDSAVPPPTDVL